MEVEVGNGGLVQRSKGSAPLDLMGKSGARFLSYGYNFTNKSGIVTMNVFKYNYCDDDSRGIMMAPTGQEME